MENIIYYYNSDIIEQLFWKKGKNRVIESEDENNLSVQPQVEAEMKFFLGKINPEIAADISHKKVQRRIVSNIRYELQVVNELFESSVEVITEQFPLSDNVIYHFLGDINLTRIFIEENNAWNINVSFSIGKYLLQGNTSPDRWKSSSLLNRAIRAKTITCNILFKRLHRNSNQKQDIQILAISEW